MAQNIYVNDNIGEVEFPDDMDDESIVNALHDNFPELGPSPYAKPAEKPVSRKTMDPGAYWSEALGTDDPNPPKPNLMATGGAGAPAPEPGSDTQLNLDAQAVPEMFGMGPEAPEAELPPDNGIGRLQTAGSQFARGASSVATGTMKSMSLADQAARKATMDELTAIDEGRHTGPFRSTDTAMYAQATSPEEREKIRRLYMPEAENVPDDPREDPMYQMAGDIDEWITNQTKVNPRYEKEFWTGKVSGGLGSMFTFVLANAIGRGLLTKTGMSAPVAGTFSTMAAGAGAQASGLFEEALAKGADLETAYTTANWGALIGTSEALPIMMMLNRLDKGTGGTIRHTVLNMLKEGTEEAVQEGFQTISQNGVIKGYLDPKTNIWTGSGEGAGVGFTTGAIMSLLLSMVGLKRGRLLKKGENLEKIQAQEDQQEQEELEQTAIAQQEQAAIDLANMPEPIPAPSLEDLANVQQSLDSQELQEFMDDKRPAEEIITEKQEADATEIEAAEQEEIAAEEEAISADMADQQQQAVQLEQGLAQAEAAGQIDEEALPEGTGIQADPVKVELPEDVDLAADQSDPEPTDAQKEAGNYKKGHLKLHGLDVTIENKRGDTRSGKDQDGETWEVTMPAHYGYIKRTEGADGDHVDVYIGEHPTSKEIFLVDQIDPETGKFDEHKVILGTDSLEQAGSLYHGGFSDGTGASRMGAITPMKIAQFKNWLKNGNTKKPFQYKKDLAPAKQRLASAKQRPPASKARQVNPGKDSLLAAIAKIGGLNSSEASAQGIDSAEFKTRGWRIHRVFTKDGLTFDEMAERLSGLGYPVVDAQGNYNPNTLLEVLSGALLGGKVFTQEGAVTDAEAELAFDQQNQAELEALAQITEKFDDTAKDLAVQIHEASTKLGEDTVEAILERTSLQSESLSNEEYEQLVISSLQEAIDGDQQDQVDASPAQGRPSSQAGQEQGQAQDFQLAQQKVTQPKAAPQAPAQGDLLGGKSETQQAILDAKTARKEQQAKAPPVESEEGALFSGKSKQVDIAEPIEAKAKVEKKPKKKAEGKPPDKGLVVANIGAYGRVYYGKVGDLHHNLSERYPHSERGDWQKVGFAGPDGKVLTRSEALSWMQKQGTPVKPSKNIPDELDAADMREQIKQPEAPGIKDIKGATIPADLMVDVKIDIVDSEESGTATLNAADTMSDLQAKKSAYEQLQDCLR